MLLSIQPSRDPQLDNFLPARIAITISGLRVQLHCLINIVSLLGVSTFVANLLLQNVTKHSHLHEIPQPQSEVDLSRDRMKYVQMYPTGGS